MPLDRKLSTSPHFALLMATPQALLRLSRRRLAAAVPVDAAAQVDAVVAAAVEPLLRTQARQTPMEPIKLLMTAQRQQAEVVEVAGNRRRKMAER